jgi:hypothetical protein
LILHASDEAFLLMNGFTGQVFLNAGLKWSKSTSFSPQGMSLNYPG